MSTTKFLLAALSSVALAVPVVEERQTCAALYGQCGGIGWTGATCCVSGATCQAGNDYYSQCLPGAAATTTTGAGTTTTTTKASSTTSTTSKASSTTTTKVTTTATTTKATTTAVGTGTATYSGNPFAGVTQWANSFYKSEVSASAVPTLGTGAAAVADVPNFMWLDTLSKVQDYLADTLTDIRAANKAGGDHLGLFVVYDLPDRDCAAAASNGEYSIADNGVANYKAYIDAIRTILVEFSDVRVALVVEPDSLANLVTNLSVSKCSNAQSAYLECTNYAVMQLNLPNVAMYLDAGHAGWLGWPANLQPAATLFYQVYEDAGKPAALRGLATNVANYNAWTISTCPSYTQGNAVCDESSYINELSPLLSAQGWDAYFITDTGRNGVQPTQQQAWGDWCNVIGTGFGIRPSSDTGSDLLDAFTWVKPGGECDGTSDTSAARYDYHCGLADALQPAPEAGSWFEAYFEQLYNNANPSFT
ncbi:carbohydrate-binding module family 1 [Xylariaceae sp. FL1272]|nr:carbohydrate-binding module family 1 [Xylariaceae sp. FL1272]